MYSIARDIVIKYCITIVLFFLSSCSSVSNETIDTRTECVYVSERFKSNQNLPESASFKKDLANRYIGHYRREGNAVLMYAENSRMQFVYSVYGMSGEFIGLRDFQGNELTVKEWTEYGPFSDPHDNTVERLSKFKTEREIFLSEKIEGKIKGPVPIFASGKPSHCKSR